MRFYGFRCHSLIVHFDGNFAIKFSELVIGFDGLLLLRITVIFFLFITFRDRIVLCALTVLQQLIRK